MDITFGHDAVVKAIKKHAADRNELPVTDVDLRLQSPVKSGSTGTACLLFAVVSFAQPEGAESLTEEFRQSEILQIVSDISLATQTYELVTRQPPSFIYDEEEMKKSGEVKEFKMKALVRKKATNYAASFDH